LAELVSSIWVHRGEGRPVATELVLPTGDVDLILDLGGRGPVVRGPSTLPVRLRSAGRAETVGAVLRLGAGAAFLGVPLAELRDCRVSLAELWGPIASELHQRVRTATGPVAKLDAVERILSTRLGRVARGPHPLAARVAMQIALRPESWRIADLGESFGISIRRLEQVFRAEIGIGPKAYQRLLRFRRAVLEVDRAAEIGWGAFALERGYYDQSHFIGEFRAHCGLTPSGYLDARGPELNHVPVAA
jgi:AraC-like DNA-binding protein